MPRRSRALYHMIETVFPMHRHQRIAVFIHKKESAISVNHLFKSRRLPDLNDASEAFGNILRHGQFPRSCICLRGCNYQLHVRSPLELVVDVEDFVFQVNVPQSQPAELCFCQVKSKKILFFCKRKAS